MIRNFVSSCIFLSTVLFTSTGCSTKENKVLKPDIVNKNVNSLNISAIQTAQVSYKEAKKVEADYFAPITFALADKELKKAVEIIETDYSKSKEISDYALQANENYQKAIRIAQMSKDFEKKDFANEDYILWYWEQLKNINSPTKTKLDLSKENNIIVGTIRENIATLSQSLEESQNDYVKLTQDYAALKKLKVEKEKKVELYDFAKEVLTSDEAIVSKKDGGILLFVTGFHFSNKEAELGSENIELINKITKIITREASSTVDIIAHTDSIGTVMQNQKLSQARAENILKSLAKFGSIDTSKVTIKAMGESSPVVSNMLKAGRAKNRRIEIYIHK